MRDADALRGGAGVAHILDAAAGAAGPQRAIVGLGVEAHGDANDIVPLLVQERGGDGGVHPTGHGNQDTLGHRCSSGGCSPVSVRPRAARLPRRCRHTAETAPEGAGAGRPR